MNCYDAIDLMGEALEGSLAVDARAGLDDHLEECDVCRTYFEQLNIACRALGSLHGPGATSRRRSELIAAFKEQHPRRG